MTRWHSVRVGRPQTLAEHHYLVSIFTNKLAKDILPEITDTERLQMVEYAMWHDLPEIICGDLPSPLKMLKRYTHLRAEDLAAKLG